MKPINRLICRVFGHRWIFWEKWDKPAKKDHSYWECSRCRKRMQVPQIGTIG